MQKYFVRQQQSLNDFESKTNNEQFKDFQKRWILLSWATCSEYAFSKEFNILVAIKFGVATVFDFSDEKQKVIQVIKSPYKECRVSAVCYMKQCKSFVFADAYGNVIIQRIIEDSKKIQIQYFLDDHMNPNRSADQRLTLNKQETLIIQSEAEGRVNFWMKKNDSWILYQTQLFSDSQISALELSLDEMNFVIFNTKGQIIICQQNNDQRWIKKQLIYFEKGRISWDISFCELGIFAVHPITRSPKKLVFFKQNKTNALYEIMTSYSLEKENYGKVLLDSTKINLQQYDRNNQDQLKMENQEFGMIKRIFFPGHSQWGTAIDNGKYIIVVNTETQQFLFYRVIIENDYFNLLNLQ